MFEQLASIEHTRWANWQKHIHSICVKNKNGTLTIPKRAVDKWKQQIKTDYEDLSEKEKEDDRDQVRRYWDLISK